MKEKILSMDGLKDKIGSDQKKGKKVVLCYGVFGVLHVGHIRYFKQAKAYGDVLVVVIASDNHADLDQNENYESLRAETLAHLDWVDAVAINTYGNMQEMVRVLRPDVYAKGFESVAAGDRVNHSAQEARFFQSLGIEYVVVKEGDFSTTAQINRYLSSMTKDVMNYIYLFKQRHTIGDLLGPLEALRKLRVMVIGDTILDEYHYCTPIGKSSKDPVLVIKDESHDLFAGGVLAVANHVSNFSGHVDLVTVLGEKDDHEEFIRSKLNKNIEPFFVYKPNAPTLVKKRFIDGYSIHKLFEVYVMDDSCLDQDLDRALCQAVQEKMSDCDVVVVADYGHGALSKSMVQVLTRNAPFLAVNTQTNAGNRGFNTIGKYPRADYVSLAEHEIRLETRDLSGRIVPMMIRLAREMSCRQFVVTRGRQGCMVLDEEGVFIQVPSFAQNVVDRVGAGDAFFAVTALLSSLGVSNEVLGFVGNAMGSLAVEIMGNEKSIDKDKVKTYIRQLLGGIGNAD